MRVIIIVLFILAVGSASATPTNEEFGPDMICPATLNEIRGNMLKDYQHLPEGQRLEAFEKEHKLFGLWQPYLHTCQVVDLVPMLDGIATELKPEELLKPTLDLMVTNGEISEYEFSEDMTYVILVL